MTGSLHKAERDRSLAQRPIGWPCGTTQLAEGAQPEYPHVTTSSSLISMTNAVDASVALSGNAGRRETSREFSSKEFRASLLERTPTLGG